jgi:hypothetical protein
MAKYGVDYDCGHSGEVQLYGPGKERENKLEWLATTLCPDCWQAKKDKERQEAAKAGADAGLTGSEKQIAWAAQIQAKRAEEQAELLSKMECGKRAHIAQGREWTSELQGKEEKVRAACDLIMSEKSAHAWIEQREESFRRLVAVAAKV